MEDENEFFRQATLRICGHLEIEKAMAVWLDYIQAYIPVDQVFLHIYEPGFGAVRTIASATAAEGQRMDLLTPVDQESQQKLGHAIDTGIHPIYIFNHPKKSFVTRILLHSYGLSDSLPVLVMNLTVEDGMPCSMVLISNGQRDFTEEHGRLCRLLRDPIIVAVTNTLTHMKVLRLNNLLADDNRYLHRELHRLSGVDIVGEDFGLRGVMEAVRQVSAADSPVLLLGETGVGKDVIAGAIHNGSQRREGPFIKVNCGAIPESLIDSELFGHEKGAFTGAFAKKRGRFERAHGGTIFLDEIGDLPPSAQVRLLRVLQNKEIERVGGTEPIDVDIRVVAATHRDLESMVKDGTFRDDLWFRIAVFPIRIPPLRERREDIPALVNHILTCKSRELKLSALPVLEAGAMCALDNYDWPGNVRELENVIERALIVNREGRIDFAHLGTQGRDAAGLSSTGGGFVETGTIDDVLAAHIRRTLSATGGRVHGVDGAAERLGANPSTLRSKMKKLGIPFGKREI